jgi:Tol biopolymer transport system component
MTLQAGARLGPYEIQQLVGAGGMGEVYRARDTRLERTVAVKVLAKHLSSSQDVRDRFDREAKTISQLSHPNICALFDVGHQDGTDYLVMEYLEGETLANRLRRGPLPPDQVFRHGIEIAAALDRAHRHGIVHRDLKPGNVMLTRTGVKLLDFGLAKAFRSHPVSGFTSLPTTAHLTQEGMILGTIQYMAPEQLEGKEVDARTDIFAFGAVLYEMASGRKAFIGESQASLIGAILHAEPPPLSQSQPLAPATLDRVARKCLAKDPDERWQSAHDVASELKWLAESGQTAEARGPAVARRTSREKVGWGLAALSTAAAVAFGWLALQRPPPPAARRVFPLLPYSGSEVGSLAVSPDGRKVAMTTAEFSNEGGITIRSIDTLETMRLAGTEGAADPFWSPDGRHLGFFARGKLKRISVDGGAQQTLGEADRYGGSWNARGTILYSPAFGKPLMRVSASGGAPQPATALDASRQEVLHCWPAFLPDGDHFLYFARGVDPAKSAIWIGSLASRERALLTPADAGPVYVDPGYLLFGREGALLAQRFDPSSRKLSGDPVPLARKVAIDPSNNDLAASAGADMLVYQVHSPRNRQLTWLDRAGRPVGRIGEPAEYWNVALSPDEKLVAAAIADAERRTGDIWIVDVARGTRTRLTPRPTDDFMPRWSADGYVYYTSDPQGYYDIFRTAASGTGGEESVYQSHLDKWVTDLARDGKTLLCYSFDLKTGYDVWTVPIGSEGKAEPLFKASFPETDAQFSPDGHWITYSSRESGRDEIFLSPRSVPARRQQVSIDGGSMPRWARDGREIFFISPSRHLMAASVRLTESVAEVLEPKPLFASPNFDLGWDPRVRTSYEVSSDGRFLFAVPVEETEVRPLMAVVDWAAGLPR